MSETRRAHVLISGRVQGVFFRSSTAELAERLGVTGWISNRPDGRVEAELQGAEGAVAQVVDHCRSGPPGATVSLVEVTELEPVAGEHAFEVR
jgi:acylphosphatase